MKILPIQLKIDLKSVKMTIFKAKMKFSESTIGKSAKFGPKSTKKNMLPSQ